MSIKTNFVTSRNWLSILISTPEHKAPLRSLIASPALFPMCLAMDVAQQYLAYNTGNYRVIINDCHYMDRQDSLSIDILNCIRLGKDFCYPKAKNLIEAAQNSMELGLLLFEESQTNVALIMAERLRRTFERGPGLENEVRTKWKAKKW